MTGDQQTDSQQTQLLQMEQRKDAAYLERNQCVALIARMALSKGYRAGIARTAIEGWSEDWHGCVYVNLPTGQASWHYHDSQAHLFSGLPLYTATWDGHDTAEKYRRVAMAFDSGQPVVPHDTPSDRAVRYLIGRVQADPRLAYLIGPGSQAWDLLTEALADTQHRQMHEVQAELERGLQVTPWPRAEG